MALSNTQKLLKARTLGMAVRRLRDDLGLTREGLATAVHHHLEPGMIYRWESGKNSPSPDWRKFLAAFARRRGCLEAAAAFEEPMHAWKALTLNAEDRRLLTLFEIILLNRPAAPDAWPPVMAWSDYERMVQAVEDAAAGLKKSHRQRFAVTGTKRPPVTWIATTLTDEQKETWMRETNPRAKRALEEKPDGAVVIRYSDGRVEVRKDEENARG